MSQIVTTKSHSIHAWETNRHGQWAPGFIFLLIEKAIPSGHHGDMLILMAVMMVGT